MSSPTVMRLDPSTGWTCLACKLVFSSGQLQREHYRSEWHLYNMKRQIAALPPLTERDFLEKLQHFSQHQQNAIAGNDANSFSSIITATASSLLPTSSNLSSFVCTVCHNKRFHSRNAFDNHLKSRRHKEEEEEQQPTASLTLVDGANECQTTQKTDNGESAIVEEMLSEAMTETDDVVPIGNDEAKGEQMEKGDAGVVKQEDGIPPNECLFCELKFNTWETNLEHMSMQHGFMIPDLPFCADVPALLIYLGFKIGVGLTCIRCQCARFRSLDALRKHMRDSNHCNFRIDSQQEDGDVLLEFMDFYDYSKHKQSAAEDESDNGSGDEDGTEEGAQTLDAVLSDEGAFLVLPSGARIGHRSLVRYFRQRLGYSSIISGKRLMGGPQKCNAVISESQIKEVRVRARDVLFMKRTVARYRLKRELASNKLFRSRGRNDQQ